MKKIQKLQQEVDKYDYWDERVISMSSDYFSDQLSLLFEHQEDNSVELIFMSCYKTLIEHDIKYPKTKPMKNIDFREVPYFIQDIKISNSEFEGLYLCNINAYPLTVEILFKNLKSQKRK